MSEQKSNFLKKVVMCTLEHITKILKKKCMYMGVNIYQLEEYTLSSMYVDESLHNLFEMPIFIVTVTPAHILRHLLLR